MVSNNTEAGGKYLNSFMKKFLCLSFIEIVLRN